MNTETKTKQELLINEADALKKALIEKIATAKTENVDAMAVYVVGVTVEDGIKVTGYVEGTSLQILQVIDSIFEEKPELLMPYLMKKIAEL